MIKASWLSTSWYISIKGILYRAMVKTDKVGSNNCSAYDTTAKTIILCQDDTLRINCDDSTTIKVASANYGRSNSEPCREYTGIESFNCNHREKTMSTLEVRCEGRKSCVVPVTEEVFGNPCFGITEYLEVSYHCENRCNDPTTSRTEKLVTTAGKRTTEGRSTTAFVDTDQFANQTLYNVTMKSNVNKNNLQPELDWSQSKVLAVAGGVLGGILAIVLILIVYTILKRYICLKERQKTTDNSSIRMNETNLDPHGQYTYSYSELAVKTSPTVNVCNSSQSSAVAENTYNVSSHIQRGNESGSATYGTSTTDNTYDVTTTCGAKSSDDVNDAYDHFFGQTTEDNYDIGGNVSVGQLNNSGSDLYS